jgi:hypothetical protein
LPNCQFDIPADWRAGGLKIFHFLFSSVHGNLIEDVVVTVDDLRQNGPLMERAQVAISEIIGSDTLSRGAPKELKQRMLFFKRKAWAETTWKGMRTAFRAYLVFCFFYGLTYFPPFQSYLFFFAVFLSLILKLQMQWAPIFHM